MKFVYILSSDSSDCFIEQALISMYSLTLNNKDPYIILITDKKTKETIVENRARINSYVKEVIVCGVPEGLNKHQISRYLKTSARSYVSGDFIYIDNDTIILENLDKLKNFESKIGAVLNGHYINRKKETEIYCQKTGRKQWKYEKYFNTGFLVVKDTEETRKFYNDWHRLWNEDRENNGIKMDQPSFSLSNFLNGEIIEELPAVYNNQIFSSNPHRFFFSPKVIHYFASSPDYDFFPFKRVDILKEIRKKGITPYIDFLVRNPLEEYLKVGVITSVSEWENYEKPLFYLSRKYGKRLKKTAEFIEFLLKIRRKILGIK